MDELEIEEFQPRNEFILKRHKKPVIATMEENSNEYVPIVPKEKRAILRKFELAVKNLPSQGKCYDKNARIFYSEYLHAEIKKVSAEMDHMHLDQLFKLVYEGIYTENFDKSDITFDDFLFIALQRKIQTFPTDSMTYFPYCHKCGRQNQKNYKLNTFEFYDLEMPRKSLPIKREFDVAYETMDDDGTTPITINEKLELEFMPLTMGNFFKLYDNKLDDDENAYRIFQCVNKDALNLLENEFKYITFDNGSKLEEIDLELSHGFKPKKDVCKLPSLNPETGEPILDKRNKPVPCNGTLIFEVDTSYELVIPFRPSFFVN